MRIVGGAFKGRPIVAPKGVGTRPTTDRTRESLFNILHHRDGFSFDGIRVIDLFAGSGALGCEAMSRGGAFCLFVETAAAARGAIRQNQETLALTGATRIHRRSATGLGPKPNGIGEGFDLAFLDPPYGEGLVDPALTALRDGEWMVKGALCVVEQSKSDPEPQVEGFTLDDERQFGDSMVRFLVVA
ncbi:MAG: 16S rRNA (guanine(966)-N(2))-methyltransferase RsmD [Pseudomonadota bacterium]